MRWKETTYSGWGRALDALGKIARPEKVAALNAIMANTPAPAIGNRRSYGDTALNSDGHVTDMTRLDRFLGFNPETGLLEAEAGATIGDILDTFGPQGWMPAVMPGTGFATLGGCIANDVHGKNHQLAGSFGQHVESILLVGASGKPQRISLKRNAPLFRATIGGLGQTGVILTARIHLAKCSAGTMAVQERRMADLDSFMDGFAESNAAYSVGWVDTTASGVDLGRGILEEANFSSGAFAKPRKTRSIPFNVPGFVMGKPLVKLFNKLYLRRLPLDGRDRERSLNDFFFPLDRILNWNRLYGKKGFHQFQCVLPHDTARTQLTKLLEEISNSGLCSPLSVLKQMGAGRGGMMSFPMEGMTLAVDIANKPKSAALLARLNDITLSGKGRVYLAKDSSLDPTHLSGMNPELPAFREVVAKADPDGAFATDQSRRLNLRGTA
ncbi:MAG: FAD-binding oxidoreductase [Rhodobacteraceae bacterium]|nr:FAD-binding oxidoreductase [Paracoccaceae bacterium]